jgi:hypothetical protein
MFLGIIPAYVNRTVVQKLLVLLLFYGPCPHQSLVPWWGLPFLYVQLIRFYNLQSTPL